jgi:hypothetical protein
MTDQAQARAELQQLADALTRHGYHATLITPAPYLALHLPGTSLPYMIYNSSGHYWWHAPQNIALSGQTTRAAELITWGLRNLTHHNPAPTHDTTAHPTDRNQAHEW